MKKNFNLIVECGKLKRKKKKIDFFIFFIFLHKSLILQS